MLNENQTLAVNHIYGPCLTLAGPGSGKTTVLVERILNLINNGINPGSILVITFTKDAAQEMKNRFLCKSYPHTYDVVFGTFHSIFYKILKSHRKYSDYELLQGNRKLALLKECLEIKGVEVKNNKDVQALEKEISYFYNTYSFGDMDDSYFSKDELKEILSEYEKRKESAKFLDFDDLLVKTLYLLNMDKEYLAKWQDRFSFFMVDEFQDLNGVQFDVLKILLKNHPCNSENIFCVGDDDQSIYGFRGSSPKYMIEFPKVFKDTKIIELDTNYRSCKRIVTSSKILIGKNKERYFKDYKANNEDAGAINALCFENDIKEAEYIADLIKNESEDLRIIDTAILYRNRSQASFLYSLLKKYGIEVFSDEPIKELKDTFVAKEILAYLRMAIGPVKRSDVLSVLNKPDRQLSRGGLTLEYIDFDKWIDYYPKSSATGEKIRRLKDQLYLLAGFSPYSAVNFIKKGIGYDEYLKSVSRLMKIPYEELMAFSDGLLAESGKYESIEKFISDMDLQMNTEDSKKREKKNEKVSMYTFHGSKGLEFDRVFILDANEGTTPSKNADNNQKLEEERRMFYVAITRAKRELNICVSKKRGEQNQQPSRFISDMECFNDEELGENQLLE